MPLKMISTTVVTSKIATQASSKNKRNRELKVAQFFFVCCCCCCCCCWCWCCRCCCCCCWCCSCCCSSSSCFLVLWFRLGLVLVCRALFCFVFLRGVQAKGKPYTLSSVCQYRYTKSQGYWSKVPGTKNLLGKVRNAPESRGL